MALYVSIKLVQNYTKSNTNIEKMHVVTELSWLTGPKDWHIYLAYNGFKTTS